MQWPVYIQTYHTISAEIKGGLVMIIFEHDCDAIHSNINLFDTDAFIVTVLHPEITSHII